jgi:hypothetical protein
MFDCHLKTSPVPMMVEELNGIESCIEKNESTSAPNYFGIMNPMHPMAKYKQAEE